ncbi:MAG: hypothetical protein AB7K24_05605 [Gemmataceae bacterium]
MFDDRESELSDALRQAIEQIKQEPVPQAHLQRALHRARIATGQWSNPDLMRYLLILGGCVAAVLVSVVIFPVIIALVGPKHETKQEAPIPKYEYQPKKDKAPAKQNPEPQKEAPKNLPGA